MKPRAVGCPTRSGLPFSAVGAKTRSPGGPLVGYITRSLNWEKERVNTTSCPTFLGCSEEPLPGTGSSTDAPGRVVQQSSIEIDPPSDDPQLSRGIHGILSDPTTSSNQPVRSSSRNDHTPFDWQTSSNQLAQSPDRVSATSRKSGSLKRVKHIWYYYTCRCCSE